MNNKPSEYSVGVILITTDTQINHISQITLCQSLKRTSPRIWEKFQKMSTVANNIYCTTVFPEQNYMKPVSDPCGLARVHPDPDQDRNIS